MSRAKASRVAKRLSTIALGTLGLVAIGALVEEAGASTITSVFASAWPALVVMVVLEAVSAVADGFAVRALHGRTAAAVGPSTWIRGGAMAVACAQLLPGGRVLGEIARATTLAPTVTRARAAAVVLRAHGSYLLIVSLSTFLCWAFVASRGASSAVFEGLLLFGGAFNAALSALFLFGPRLAGVGGFLGRRLGLSAVLEPGFHEALGDRPLLELRPLSYYAGARLAHAFASLAALVAVGVSPGVATVLASEGIQLVAAHTGDTVPGQVGVLEGAYRLFGPAIGLGNAAGFALAIALMFRAARLTLALGAMAVAASLSCGRSRVVLVAAAALVLVSSHGGSAQAQDPAPAKLLVRQRAVAVLNPMGVEHMVGVAVRLPLFDDASPLLADTHLELGANAYTSPVYSMTGGYLQLSPLAFWVLRAELTGLTLWSIGMDGAGYYPVEGYDADVRAQSLPGNRGGVASGYNLQLSTIIQGAVGFGRWRAILWSQLTAELERLGEEDFHYSPKYDLVLARSDWMIASSSMALLERALSARLSLRVGVYDDFRVVAASGARAHQLGGTAMLSFASPGSCVSELLVFVRGGAYLQPERRAGQGTGLLGLMVRYDLADL